MPAAAERADQAAILGFRLTVGIARDFFQPAPVGHGGDAFRAPDRARRLQRVEGDRHTLTAHGQHHRQEFVRKLHPVVVRPVVAHE